MMEVLRRFHMVPLKASEAFQFWRIPKGFLEGCWMYVGTSGRIER